MVSKGQIVGIDWNCIVRLHRHALAHMNSLTASRCLFSHLIGNSFIARDIIIISAMGFVNSYIFYSTSFAPSYLVFVDMSVTVQ